MNGPQDLGGMMGFGPVAPEADEPVFHTPWERRAFAINLAMGMTGSWNIDTARHARERLPPLTYWSSSYYEMRHYALIKQLLESELMTAGEEAMGQMSVPPRPLKRVPGAALIPAVLAGGSPYDRPAPRPQSFQAGDQVRARNLHPPGHTRLPRYLRGHAGEIIKVHGCHVLPDSSAHGKGDNPHWLYAVKFSASDVWGKPSRDSLVADLWETYLEATA